MKLFSVTFETIIPPENEDEEIDDSCVENGFVLEDVSLKDAVNELGGTIVEPSCYPFDPNYPHVWFTTVQQLNYATGESTRYSLHMPDDLTASTRKRIARLLGVR